MNPRIPTTSSLGRRSASVFAITLTLALFGSGYGALALHRIDGEIDAMTAGSIATERIAADCYRNVAASLRRTAAIAVSSDPSLGAFFAADIKETTSQNNALLARMKDMVSSPQEKAAYDDIVQTRKGYLVARDQIAVLKKAGDSAGARLLLDNTFVPAAKKFQASLQELTRLQRQEVDDASSDIRRSAQHALVAVLVFGAIALVVCTLLARRLTRSITRSIHVAVEAANRIAHFDLTQQITTHRRDETGLLLGALVDMQAALRNMVGQVRASTVGIGSASAEIAAGNMDLSMRTEEASSSLQQTASAVEHMADGARESSASIASANELAGVAATVATQGGEVVSRVVATMEEINGSSRRIADIIGVIDGIAFQTNILALNAAVEAARAGPQGRGFAVVATEVRSLAQRSAQAAKEIKELIGTSVDKVAVGSKLAADAGTTMTEVVGSARRVSEIIADLSRSAAHQSDGLGQVNAAVAQLDSVTQQNAALAEQSMAAAESLKGQAAQLAEMAQRFLV